jgi:hypothetical protein
MLNTPLLLAQWDPAYAFLELAAMAGVIVVPATLGAWVLWARNGRPRSRVAVLGMGAISAIFVLWAVAAVGFFTYPSTDEEMAVETVESAFPILDTSTWSYSARHPSPDIWIVTVKGRTPAGQAIDEKFRVTPDAVERALPGTASRWVILKESRMSGAPTSMPTSAP